VHNEHGCAVGLTAADISSRKSAKLIKGAVEIYYPGLPHGLTATHADLVNRDLLAFCQQGKRKVA
jgi:non-heme chloroperoxidase